MQPFEPSRSAAELSRDRASALAKRIRRRQRYDGGTSDHHGVGLMSPAGLILLERAQSREHRRASSSMLIKALITTVEKPIVIALVFGEIFSLSSGVHPSL